MIDRDVFRLDQCRRYLAQRKPSRRWDFDSVSDNRMFAPAVAYQNVHFFSQILMGETAKNEIFQLRTYGTRLLYPFFVF